MGTPILYSISGIQLNCGMRIGITGLVYVHTDIIQAVTFQFIEAFRLVCTSVG